MKRLLTITFLSATLFAAVSCSKPDNDPEPQKQQLPAPPEPYEDLEYTRWVAASYSEGIALGFVFERYPDGSFVYMDIDKGELTGEIKWTMDGVHITVESYYEGKHFSTMEGGYKDGELMLEGVKFRKM